MASNTIDPNSSQGDFQKDKEANQVRFEEDLEVEHLLTYFSCSGCYKLMMVGRPVFFCQFVQSLANPHFVQELTLNGTLRSETMVKLGCPISLAGRRVIQD